MLSKKRLLYLTYTILFLLVFLSPPFIFEGMAFSTRELRMFLGLLVAVLLVLCHLKLYKQDITFILIMAALLAMEFLLGLSDYNNILSYYAVIIIGFLLYRLLRYMEISRELFLKFWVGVAYFLSISLIISYVLILFSIDGFDWFGFSSLLNLRLDFKYTIFGLGLQKDFNVFTVVRASSYFYEPSLAGLYFAINVLLSQESFLKNKRKWFLAVNLFAGTLTFSIAFFIAMILFYMFRTGKVRSKLLVLLVSLLLIAISIVFLDGDGMKLVPQSSIGDRLLRMSNSFNILSEASISKYLHGHGVGYNETELGFSSGFFRTFVERGLIGVLLVFSLLLLYTRKKSITFLIYFFYFFVIVWSINYIYWIGIIALWVRGRSFTMNRG